VPEPEPAPAPEPEKKPDEPESPGVVAKLLGKLLTLARRSATGSHDDFD
jgi:hypothetical protein